MQFPYRLTLYLLLSMTFVNGEYIIIANVLSIIIIIICICVAPFELLSLWLDVPWIVVLNDFRIGLLMGLLCLHWIWFISQTVSILVIQFLLCSNNGCRSLAVGPLMKCSAKTGYLLYYCVLAVSHSLCMNSAKGVVMT